MRSRRLDATSNNQVLDEMRSFQRHKDKTRQTLRKRWCPRCNGEVTTNLAATATNRRTPVQPSAKVAWDPGGTSWRKGRASSTKKEKKRKYRSFAHLPQKNVTPPSHRLRTRCTREALQSDSFSALTNHGVHCTHLNHIGERNVEDIMRMAVEQEHRPTKCRVTLSQA